MVMPPVTEEALAARRLGDGGGPMSLASREDNRLAALALARQAHRRLDILTPDLEAPVYNSSDFVEALTRLALGSPHARIRILTLDLERAIKEGHRLIEFCRRLSSYAEIRLAHEDDRDDPRAFVLADDAGLLYRRLSSRFEGFVDFSNPAEVRQLRAPFDEAWERASPDSELRRLHL